jgi:mitochondrial inner membrane protease subunit 1
MLPTLYSNDWLLIDKISPLIKRYKQGEIIACKSPHDPGVFISKRIIGMEGDVICVNPTESSRKYIRIPQGHVWLQGDNYQNSIDSRTFGPIPEGLLIGRIYLRVWPNLSILQNGFQHSIDVLNQASE